MKKVFLTFAVMALTLAIVGCRKDKPTLPPTEPEPQPLTLAASTDSFPEGAAIIKAIMFDPTGEKEDVLVSTGTITGEGEFEITLPAVPDPAALNPINASFDWFPADIYDGGAQGFNITLTVYPAGGGVFFGTLSRSTMDYVTGLYREVMYVYVDSDATINGTFNSGGIDFIYDMTLTKGWNEVYREMKYYSDMYVSYTCPVPESVTINWIFNWIPT